MDMSITRINYLSYDSITGCRTITKLFDEKITKELSQEVFDGQFLELSNQNFEMQNLNGLNILSGQNQVYLKMATKNSNISEKTLSIIQEKFDNANIKSFDDLKNSQIQKIFMESAKESGLIKNLAASNQASIGQVNAAIDKFLTDKLNKSENHTFTPAQTAIINDFNDMFANETFMPEPASTFLNQILQ